MNVFGSQINRVNNNSNFPIMQILDTTGFADDFQRYYLDRGFGTMNKNDFEVLFFYLLQTYGDLQGKSNFSLAKELEVSEARIKRLSYEADLKYKKESDERIRERFLSLLGKAQLQKDKDNPYLRFVVEDKYLRSSIYEDLKSDGYFLDFLRNSEVVSIHKDALIRLLDKYYSEEQKKEICDEYKRVRKNVKKDESSLFPSVMSSLFDAVIQKGVDEVDFRSLVKCIAKGAAGISGILKIISAIMIM